MAALMTIKVPSNIFKKNTLFYAQSASLVIVNASDSGQIVCNSHREGSCCEEGRGGWRGGCNMLVYTVDLGEG